MANFWATVCKTVRPTLSDLCLSCLSSLSVCPVCDVGGLVFTLRVRIENYNYNYSDVDKFD